MIVTEPESKTRLEIWNRLKNIDNVPTLPVIYFKLEKLLKDPNATIVSVRRVIEEDPPIVAKILQRVNSGYYNLSHSVNNIQQAIVILGMTEIYDMVVELSVLSMFQGMPESSTFNFSKFWKHSSGTARTASAIRKYASINLNNAEFSAGLLHDFGRLILYIYFHELYDRVFEISREQRLSLYEAERQVMNFSHTEAGYWLARRWHLPGEVAEVMLHHHNVRAEDVREYPLRAVVHLANKITSIWGFGLQPNPDFQNIEEDAVWQEMLRVYPKLRSFPLDDMDHILNMPSDEAGSILNDETIRHESGCSALSSLKDILESMMNSFNEIQRCLDEKEIAWEDASDIIRKLIASILKTDLMTIYRWNPATEKLEIACHHGEPESALDTINFRRGKGAVRWIMQNGASMLINEETAKANISEKNVNSFLGVPIVVSNKLSGVLVIGAFAAGCYGDNEQYLLEVAGEYLGRLLRFAE